MKLAYARRMSRFAEASSAPPSARANGIIEIAEIKVHVLKSPLTTPFAFSQGWVRQRSATLVEVHTDEGIRKV